MSEQEDGVNIDKRNDGDLFALSADLYLRLADWNARAYGKKPVRINRKPAHRKMTDAQRECLEGAA